MIATSHIQDFEKLFKRLNLSLDRKIRKLKQSTKLLRDPKSSEDAITVNKAN